MTLNDSNESNLQWTFSIDFFIRLFNQILGKFEQKCFQKLKMLGPVPYQNRCMSAIKVHFWKLPSPQWCYINSITQHHPKISEVPIKNIPMTGYATWNIIIIIQHYCHHSPFLDIPMTEYTTSYNMIHYHHHPTLLSSFTISWHPYDRICNIIQHDTLSSSSNIIVITHHFSPFLWQDMQHHTTW